MEDIGSDKPDRAVDLPNNPFLYNNQNIIFDAPSQATAPPLLDTQEEDDSVFAASPSLQRRRRRRSSVCSLPASTISVFSAFTPASHEDAARPKRSSCILLMNSSIMFGREFCYAVEAGLTTPILLSIGLPLHLYSLVWVISPVLGFILQPIVGNVSDRCKSPWGKRRPFILGFAIILLIGMTLFLNGEHIASLFYVAPNRRWNNDSSSFVAAAIAVTVTGVVLFDFSADFIEGPIRAYAMDVCDEEDVRRSLLFQAVSTGAGGAFGYASGGVAWTRDTPLKWFFPSDRQFVYAVSSIIFIVCCILNLISIPERDPTTVEINARSKIIDHEGDNGHPTTLTPAKRNETTRLMPAAITNVSQDGANNNRKKVNTEEDNETVLLKALMTLNRNNLFEKYDTSGVLNNASSSPPSYYKVVDEKLRKAWRGGIEKQSHKPKGVKKKSQKIGSFRKRCSTFKRAFHSMPLLSNSGESYGTFGLEEDFLPQEGEKQVVTLLGEWPQCYSSWKQPVSYVDTSKSEVKRSNRRNFYSNPINTHKYFPERSNESSAHDRILEARATYTNYAGKERQSLHWKRRYSTDSETASSSSASSISFGCAFQEHLPYAAVDPAFKNLHLHPQIFANPQNNGVVDPSVTKAQRAPAPYREELLSEVGSSASKIESPGRERKEEEPAGGLASLFRAIKSMPKELRFLCVCHLFGWVAFLSMALFFTDFVGQVVMSGDPRAPPSVRAGELYRRGVEIGNWGLTINAAVSCLYCVFLKKMICAFGARTMYVFGYFSYSVGTCFIAIFPSATVVLCLSSVMGILSATLYTLPYMLVAQYHEGYKKLRGSGQERGIGTDCALVTCMIQLAQIVTGLGVGALVNLMDTVTVTMATASIAGFLGTVWAAVCVRY